MLKEGSNMSEENTGAKLKRPYEKPELRTIELMADEVMSIGCKSDAAIGVGLSPCNVTNCSSLGS